MSTTANSKKNLKRKLLDDSILKKARAALGLPVESQDDDGNSKNDEPSLKWRKPRHNTPEGQIYVKNKEKRRREEDPVSESITAATSPNKKETDKKGKKKKQRKKKKKNQSVTTPENSAPSESSKNPDSEKKHAMEALSYLQLWTSNRNHWKFEKLKQTWLLKNCLNRDLVDEARFELLLEYIGSVKGAARKTTLTEMESTVTKYEMTGGESSATSNDDIKSQSDSQTTSLMYERARQIIQVLVDE